MSSVQFSAGMRNDYQTKRHEMLSLLTIYYQVANEADTSIDTPLWVLQVHTLTIDLEG